MHPTLLTKRLSLNELALSDSAFIKVLVNTPGWLAFIGNRNIKTDEDAKAYVQRILDNENVNYWVVRLRNTQIAVGVITFIKRDFLEHYDIGFAFLPEHSKKGYAYEATTAVLNDIIKNSTHVHILATTIKENSQSIKLLEKLGLRFDREIQNEGEKLSVYSVSTDKLSIDQLTRDFFSVFTNKDQQANWQKMHTLCIPQVIIITMSKGKETIYDLDTFIEPRKKVRSDGLLSEFEEYELSEETKIAGAIAQRSCVYEKTGLLNGIPFKGKGHKLFQYIKTERGWKINSVIWEDAL